MSEWSSPSLIGASREIIANCYWAFLKDGYLPDVKWIAYSGGEFNSIMEWSYQFWFDFVHLLKKNTAEALSSFVILVVAEY